MSDVTNLILVMTTTDAALHTIAPSLDRLAAVNRYFNDAFGLVSVNDDRLPEDWYGGSKRLETEIAIGALNNLDLDEFLSHLRSMDWAHRDAVQVIVQGQQDFRFRIIDLFPDADREFNQFWEHRSYWDEQVPGMADQQLRELLALSVEIEEQRHANRASSKHAATWDYRPVRAAVDEEMARRRELT